MLQPKTIISYLIEGLPTGIKTVEFSNRLVKGLYFPRKKLREALSRQEIEYCGIYLLIGKDDDENGIVYIGQANNLGRRIKQHNDNSKKDFWNKAVCFTYKDGSLGESDINYLERKLIEKAKVANRYNVLNATMGNSGNILEHRIPDMNELIDDIEILLSNLGFQVLNEIVSKQDKEDDNNLYYLKARGCSANGLYTPEGFLVLKGSSGPNELVNSELNNKGYAFRNRPKLLDKGVIEQKGGKILFVQDYLFSSPSSAGAFLAGRSINGWIGWKDKNGKTLDENERNEL